MEEEKRCSTCMNDAKTKDNERYCAAGLLIDHSEEFCLYWESKIESMIANKSW